MTAVDESGAPTWRARLVTAVLLGTSAMIPHAAGAATAAAPPVFGVQAAIPDQRPGLQGGHFNYALKPGDTISDSIVLTNYTTKAISLKVYPADVVTATGGGLSPALFGTRMTGVGAWITVDHPEVDLAAGGHVTDRFTVTVPPAVLPGEYVGAMVSSYAPAGNTSGESIVTREALITRVTIPGAIHLVPVLGPLQATRHNDDVAFSFDISNTGNVLFTVGGEVLVRESGGKVLTAVPVNPSGIYVIPGGTTTVSGVWHGVPAYGLVTSRAQVSVLLDNKVARTPVGEAVTMCFMPWKGVIAAATALFLALLTVYATRRRWRARLEQRRVARRFVDDLMTRRGAHP